MKFIKYVLPTLCLLALAMYAPQAKANGTDFSCGSGSCTGNVVANNGNYSGSGINLLAGPWNLPLGDGDEGGGTFALAFDTATGSITLTDADGDATLTGTITSFSTSGSGLFLNVVWTTPSGFASNPSVVIVDVSDISSCTGNGCAASSVDVQVLPTPEPASLLLLGTGLLGMGGAVRRRLLQ